jgi:hypothetical protein
MHWTKEAPQGNHWVPLLWSESMQQAQAASVNGITLAAEVL